jgi:hypothetical protein
MFHQGIGEHSRRRYLASDWRKPSPRKLRLPGSGPCQPKAAVEGTLPRGIGIARLADPPAEWSRQQRMLGFTA